MELHILGVWGHQLLQVQQDLNSMGCISLWDHFKHYLSTALLVSSDWCFPKLFLYLNLQIPREPSDRKSHRKGHTNNPPQSSHNPRLGILNLHRHWKSARTDWAVIQRPFRPTESRFWALQTIISGQLLLCTSVNGSPVVCSRFTCCSTHHAMLKYQTEKLERNYAATIGNRFSFPSGGSMQLRAVEFSLDF